MNDDDRLKVARRYAFTHGRTCGTCKYINTLVESWCYQHNTHESAIIPYPQSPACPDYKFGLPDGSNDRRRIYAALIDATKHTSQS